MRWLFFLALAVGMVGGWTLAATTPPSTTVALANRITTWVGPPIHLRPDLVTIRGDRVWVDFPCPAIITVSAGRSMVPVAEAGSIFLATTCFTQTDIRVGDIVIYKPLGVGELLAHQVVKLGQDSQGWFAWVQGTNNAEPDVFPVRWANIQALAVGVLW